MDVGRLEGISQGESIFQANGKVRVAKAPLWNWRVRKSGRVDRKAGGGLLEWGPENQDLVRQGPGVLGVGTSFLAPAEGSPGSAH